ncbi:MAG: hypothetical protein U0K87_00450 [Ruminococcus sp.]|nr:hypothetical protein [Ruminococcus sp.]
MNKKQAYFYLPDELFTNDYKDYSNESKLLFAMLLTNMQTAKGVMDTARLINEIGSRKISSMHKIVESEIQKSLESEGL